MRQSSHHLANERLKVLNGFLEILALRKGLWESIERRQHRPMKVFPFGPNANEVMLYGTVQYRAKTGKESTVDWAAHAYLVEEDDAIKMTFYQVYLVCEETTKPYIRFADRAI